MSPKDCGYGPHNQSARRPTSPPETTTRDTSGTKPKRTAEEQRYLDCIALTRGRAWVEEHAEMILNQARDFGDL
jgi:hypothetical protein